MKCISSGPGSGNLFEFGAPASSDEQVDALVEDAGVSIERIVSRGHASPPDFWYDSPRAEWVALLSGAATLEFEGEREPHPMKSGDYVLIEAHCRHRVAWTSDTEPSVWLAVYTPEVPR
ncbi:cupin domain-containing protein [Paraburkholderia fungorum]|jgi:cupin 2 domain-containing protein|uniref:cupin domain-containing protein n=1 Tax=Paraburkholderia fungorum TaxID=134537 RepID=UPI00048133B9|nr:cupin domain-containing protein [Paraburkholderia fungorum]MBB5543864.1 cupin 2 domain-containing protein [Paraburkholderia fungorum]PNE57008.1 cupin domain-containing protein [Paraburkholderia fungorum]